MPTLHALDYAAIAGYMTLMASVGLLMGGLIRDVGAYFKGGGTLPWVAAAVSNYMSLFSAFIVAALFPCRVTPFTLPCRSLVEVVQTAVDCSVISTTRRRDMLGSSRVPLGGHFCGGIE